MRRGPLGVLAVGVALAVGMLVYPPQTVKVWLPPKPPELRMVQGALILIGGVSWPETHLVYGWAWEVPPESFRREGGYDNVDASIDWVLLGIQLVVLAGLVLVAFFAVRWWGRARIGLAGDARIKREV